MNFAQVQHSRELGTRRELLIVNGQDEGRSPALLLGKLTQVAIAGDTNTSMPSFWMAPANARIPSPEVFSER